jgi:hypothetical protein
MDNMCKAKFTNSTDSQSSSFFGLLKRGGKKLIGNIISSSFKTKTANIVKEILVGGVKPDKVQVQCLDGSTPKSLMSSYENIYGNFLLFC